ncbi:hypothetical protein L1889_08750 [Paenalcaligenes niemegkensis]|uniref:hypothetical protein n=1 Tax=Paenalcaligenes niemegkensis TaxID=2895469 RepID=UPI001EE93FCC|nr:hypothetical protein [Paenalcaligenes niemegkensis]MCQ9616785.1 hypothetical protein [Paenalcaligenes niemegkensis]
MSFTTYREQQRSHVSTHCRSDALLAMQASGKKQTSKKSIHAVQPRKVIGHRGGRGMGASIPTVMWLGALGGL